MHFYFLFIPYYYEHSPVGLFGGFINYIFMDNWKKIFLIIWTGQFFSILTSYTVNFAIIVWLSIHTGSAEILAYAAIASLLPQSFIGPFAGVYIDRWDRKLTMMLADGFIALC